MGKIIKMDSRPPEVKIISWWVDTFGYTPREQEANEMMSAYYEMTQHVGDYTAEDFIALLEERRQIQESNKSKE